MKFESRNQIIKGEKGIEIELELGHTLKIEYEDKIMQYFSRYLNRSLCLKNYEVIGCVENLVRSNSADLSS